MLGTALALLMFATCEWQDHYREFRWAKSHMDHLAIRLSRMIAGGHAQDDLDAEIRDHLKNLVLCAPNSAIGRFRPSWVLSLIGDQFFLPFSCAPELTSVHPVAGQVQSPMSVPRTVLKNV
jgi:hypothetical protein